MSKYGNKKYYYNGITFDSLAEHRRYMELCLLEKAGEIMGLAVHPRWPIKIADYKICTYVADFAYLDKAKAGLVVEDVKGVRTSVYKLKKKLMKALYGIDIVEVEA